MAGVKIVKCLAGGLAALLIAGSAIAPVQAGAQDMSSQINGQVNRAINDANRAATDSVNGAVNQANAEWNKFVQMANDTIPGSSALPRNPLPAPAPVPGPWAPQAPAPVANGTNGEIHAAGRSYLIWVPRGYNPANPTPVMVGYSAYQDSTENFRNYSRLRESSVGRDAIIVYPRAIGASWEGSPTAATRPGQDIAYVHAMINDVPYYGTTRRGQRVLPVPELFGSYALRNGCGPGLNRAPLYNATRVSARGCRKGVEVIQVHGSNHYWWYSPSAADEMWAFLSRHSK